MTERFRDLRARLSKPRAALEAMGLYLVGKAQQAFRDQGRGGEAWAARSVPNRAGVLSDLMAGATPPARRWDARPAAQDTGRLKGSIAYRIDGENKVVVGSTLDYASDVQRGSTKSFTVEGQLRTALAAWLRSLDGDKKRAASAAFGFLFRVRTLTVTTPPRPFVMVTDEDRKALNQIARRVLLGR